MSMPDLWALSLSLYIHKMGRWSLSLPICGKPGMSLSPRGLAKEARSVELSLQLRRNPTHPPITLASKGPCCLDFSGSRWGTRHHLAVAAQNLIPETFRLLGDKQGAG